jgi:hypothetical protein
MRQPFILATGTMEEPIQYYVIIEKTMLEVGTDFIHALDVLVSSFFTFNLQYPEHIKPFYLFLVEQVYEIKKKSPSITAFANDLHLDQFMNIDIDSLNSEGEEEY